MVYFLPRLLPYVLHNNKSQSVSYPNALKEHLTQNVI